MDKLFTATGRSLRSLTTDGMLVIFIKSLLMTIFALILLVVLCFFLGHWLGTVFSYWHYASYISWVAGFGAFILAWLCFPAIMPLIMSFFDDSIIAVIETADYPPSPVIKNAFREEFWHDLSFALKTVLINILLLPLYFFPMVNIFVFFTVNGYLLGGEFFLTVARRHLPMKEAKALRRKNLQNIWLGGIALMFLSTMPIINLFAPFWGIALMTHLYHLANRPA